MALPTAFGVKIEAMDHAALFGEDQARYVLTAAPAQAMEILANAQSKGIEARIIGEVTVTAEFKIGGTVSVSISELRRAHEGWFPAFMNGEL
jgi:phosphoribosylformylglycinamidine synthase